MSTALGFCRRFTARLAPLLALVAFVAVVAGAFHHPEPGHSHSVCAVCIISSTPAVGSTTVATPRPPDAPVERCLPTATAAPRSHARPAAHSRAPPQA